MKYSNQDLLQAQQSAHGLIPVLNSIQQMTGWRSHAKAVERTLPAIIQVDSGMSRMGLSPVEVDAWLADPRFLDGIGLRYLMSHLACADQPENPMNALQLERFRAIRARLPHCPASFANSSGIFLSSDYHFDLVRPGAALYGIARRRPDASDGAPSSQSCADPHHSARRPCWL